MTDTCCPICGFSWPTVTLNILQNHVENCLEDDPSAVTDSVSSHKRKRGEGIKVKQKVKKKPNAFEILMAAR